MHLTSYLTFSPFLARLSCSKADLRPTFSFFSRLEREVAMPHVSDVSMGQKNVVQ